MQGKNLPNVPGRNYANCEILEDTRDIQQPYLCWYLIRLGFQKDLDTAFVSYVYLGPHLIIRQGGETQATWPAGVTASYSHDPLSRKL